MLSGEIRGQIDRIWDAFWTGGISNPLEVIEQITYLLFLRRLDEIHTLEELKAFETDYAQSLIVEERQIHHFRNVKRPIRSNLSTSLSIT